MTDDIFETDKITDKIKVNFLIALVCNIGMMFFSQDMNYSIIYLNIVK
jgi:hypothetical protein